MRKLTSTRTLVAAFCWSLTWIGTSAYADYYCAASSHITPAYSWRAYIPTLQTERDCLTDLNSAPEDDKVDAAKEKETLARAEDILAHIKAITDYKICTSPLLERALHVAFTRNKQDKFIAELRRVGCNDEDQSVWTHLTPDRLSFIKAQSHIGFISEDVMRSIVASNWTMADLVTISDILLKDSVNWKKPNSDYPLENHAFLVRKIMKQIQSYGQSDETREAIRHIFKNHLTIYQQANAQSTANTAKFNGLVLLQTYGDTARVADLFSILVAAGWDINAELNVNGIGFLPPLCFYNPSSVTPFLDFITRDRLDLVRLSLSLSKISYVPFGPSSVTAYFLAAETQDPGMIDLIGKQSRLGPQIATCEYPATENLFHFPAGLNSEYSFTELTELPTLDRLAQLPSNEKNVKNYKLTEFLSKIIQAQKTGPEVHQTLLAIQNRFFPLKDFFEHETPCANESHLTSPRVFAEATRLGVDLSDSAATCTAYSIAPALARQVPNPEATLADANLFVIEMQKLGYKSALAAALKATAENMKSSNYAAAEAKTLALIEKGNPRQIQRVIRQAQAKLGEIADTSVAETATLDGQVVAFKPETLSESDEDLLNALENHWGEPETLKLAADAFLKIHLLDRDDPKSDASLGNSELQTIIAKNPSLTNLKPTIESVIESSLKAPEIFYNVEKVNVYDVLTNARLQCYSGTSLFEVALAKLGQPADGRNVNVVIYTTGHVLPGFLSLRKTGWELTGIETTATGPALVAFGPASTISVPMNVIESSDFFVAEVFKHKIAAPADYTAGVEKRMQQTYGFPPTMFRAFDTSGGSGTEAALNASLFGHGHVTVPPGDQQRASGASLMARNYLTASAAAPHARVAPLRRGKNAVSGPQVILLEHSDTVLLNHALSVLSPILSQTGLQGQIEEISGALQWHTLNLAENSNLESSDVNMVEGAAGSYEKFGAIALRDYESENRELLGLCALSAENLALARENPELNQWQKSLYSSASGGQLLILHSGNRVFAACYQSPKFPKRLNLWKEFLRAITPASAA